MQVCELCNSVPHPTHAPARVHRQALMEDPVVAADGHSYGAALNSAVRQRAFCSTPIQHSEGVGAERSAIARWLLRSQRSPCTNVAMSHTRVLPNHSLRAAIAEWRASAVASADTAEAAA